jgi:predicted dehydrogenase
LFGKIDSLVCLSEKNSDLDIDVEDSANFLLKIKQSSSNDLIIQLRMDFLRRDPHRSCTIIGERGTLIWDYISGKIEIYDSIDRNWKVLFSQVPERNETYIAEWKDLIKAIETHSNPFTTYKEAYETLQVLEAARASNGNLIEVNY